MQPIYGEGPIPCDLMLVGEAPGREEIRQRRAFVGPSGRELWRAFDGDRLPSRAQVFVTNVCKTFPENGKTPSAEELLQWDQELDDEIRIVDPRLIVALGATALKRLTHQTKDLTVERCHGLMVNDRVFCAYHPAAGLHNPDIQNHFATDMEALAELIEAAKVLGWTNAITSRWRRDDTPERYQLWTPEVKIPDRFSTDTEGSAQHPWGLTVSWEAGTAYLIKASDTTGLQAARAAFRRAKRVTAQGLLFDLDVLAAMGITIPESVYDDTQIMAYLLQLEPQGLKDLAYRHFGAEQQSYQDLVRDADARLVRTWLTEQTAGKGKVSTAAKKVLTKLEHGDERTPRTIWKGSKFSKVVDLPPEPTLDDVDPARALRYACRDADLTERLRHRLHHLIRDRGLERVYQLDLSVLPVVNRMQHVGMRIDRLHFQALVTLIEIQQLEMLSQILTCVAEEVNPLSHKQVAALLFGRLKLPPTKRTATGGYSTEDKYLEALRGAHPVVELVIRSRELNKVLGSYVAKVLDLSVEDAEGWALYPNLRITRVVSGRVSAHDPNVLAIPKHSDLGKRVRRGFIAGPGRVLLSIDLSQIELRVAAHECQDKGMLKAFIQGRDIHAELGERVFGVPADQQDESKHRLPMKKANFGYWMGISAHGLRDQLAAAGAQWSEEDCQKLLEEYDRVWPGAAIYKSEKAAQARRLGYVTDFLGRRRYLASIHSENRKVRQEAERQAFATPIQMGAQEVFKTWMASAWRSVHTVRKQRSPTRYLEPWLEVHDDFINEVDERDAQAVGEEIRACLPQLLRVPVTGKQKMAKTWGDL